MKSFAKSLALLASLTLWVGCPPAVLVPVVASTVPESADSSALEVVTRSSVADPLPLHGSRVAYTQLNQALTREISAAAKPWVEHNQERGNPHDGWQLLLELTDADASYHHGRAKVSLALRATLRTRAGNQHLAQTQTHCQQNAEVNEISAGSVFEACMHDLRTELVRWLSGITP